MEEEINDIVKVNSVQWTLSNVGATVKVNIVEPEKFTEDYYKATNKIVDEYEAKRKSILAQRKIDKEERKRLENE